MQHFKTQLIFFLFLIYCTRQIHCPEPGIFVRTESLSCGLFTRMLTSKSLLAFPGQTDWLCVVAAYKVSTEDVDVAYMKGISFKNATGSSATAETQTNGSTDRNVRKTFVFFLFFFLLLIRKSSGSRMSLHIFQVFNFRPPAVTGCNAPLCHIF